MLQSCTFLQADKPSSGGSYMCPHPGGFKVEHGQLRAFPQAVAGPIMLVSSCLMCHTMHCLWCIFWLKLPVAGPVAPLPSGRCWAKHAGQSVLNAPECALLALHIAAPSASCMASQAPSLKRLLGETCWSVHAQCSRRCVACSEHMAEMQSISKASGYALPVLHIVAETAICAQRSRVGSACSARNR